ncbi:prenyltransferase/squalene oxidase repeat-containing protein [Streptomyces lichenis]|uniref:Terpene cyclase/mutase family protein n=1 Tax=Streptomyces lichenis TaxID=2306967 RepID=A0ABT0IJ22_9ACTN|nr:prenyltransferase/squalene oxidase repeat-containing protein [Streptomyces lichenis]MCK8681307.1 terpene cyclase/mutase family protein [Streptomyces lichenis]
MTTVRVRRPGAAVLAAAAALLGTGLLGPATAASAAPKPSPSSSPAAPALPEGLYGTGDPTYDGVWRQSLAFMAQQVSGVEPARESVRWLLDQQCAGGGFAAYRPAPDKPCDDATVPDTNATAAAVQALTGVEDPEGAEEEKGAPHQAVKAGASWLKEAQNEDGGWGYNPGSPSDANSTSLVISALAATGQRPGDLVSGTGKTPYDALLGLALPCDAEPGGGAFAYQPDKAGKLAANADATAAAVLAGLGKDLRTRGAQPQQKPECATPAKPAIERAARNGAAYLADALAGSGHLEQPPLPGAEETAPAPDFGNTADAVIALAAAGATEEAQPALQWLEKNAEGWADQGGPAAYAQLVLAAHAAGADARDFGGTDLVARLNATGPQPATAPTPEAAATDQGSTREEGNGDEEGDGINTGVVVGSFLVAGIGIGFLISGRGRNRTP